MDEKEFDFNSGKRELLEIIQLANESAHATEACFDKKSKKQWWANRRALDERLQQLLYHIEVMWFGGFRGIFAHKPKSDELLSSFMDKFQNILDKHLPSRRKRGKRKDSNISLDRNVIELFVNIGSLDDEANPEDSVMDLLYFVVDILQFHGERNAYDEIDFDMMVVETLDAIRAYRSAERREDLPDAQNHTILILDRALHNFPWESLGCLHESSVSRMPSLDNLRNRISHSENSHPSKLSRPGFYVDRNCGTFILNPGGDLRSTQASFETPLSALDNWTGVIGRAPTEEEFKQALENRDLVLYFGHGSGAQYIRGRTIKRLDRCAVTFLMGCSSGTMTEAGDFESYGTAWNYLHAGTPALVATLWDVTDKDIDRFASSVFEQWGLVEVGSMNVQSPDRPNGTDRRGDHSICATSVSGPASLSAVVSQSRDACILRYLNGAAPVVYGLPVFLK
jgi:separase